jgi:hypothetical protein
MTRKLATEFLPGWKMAWNQGLQRGGILKARFGPRFTDYED